MTVVLRTWDLNVQNILGASILKTELQFGRGLTDAWSLIAGS